MFTHWHPWPQASYALNQPREWLVRIGPYATLVLKALKLAMPLAGPLAEVALTNQQLQQAQYQLDLMTAVAAELPDQADSQPAELRVGDLAHLISPESASLLTPAEGQAARVVRLLIIEHDRPRAFGGLRRMHAPSGDFVWICADHYAEYDPGLPGIPESRP